MRRGLTIGSGSSSMPIAMIASSPRLPGRQTVMKFTFTPASLKIEAQAATIPG